MLRILLHSRDIYIYTYTVESLKWIVEVNQLKND